jgi:pimeloyl-ACP methyl ester carboxylesterase/DNA-binding CsgD family transcriptional regulator
MEQTIRFVNGADGVKLAYARSGQGPVVIKSGTWLTHLEYDWKSPVWRPWFEFLVANRTLLRYDPRGCGLSDWAAADLAFDKQVEDFERVVDAAGHQRFAVLGMSQGASIGIEYAARHPDRVTHLILYGGYALGWLRRGPESVRLGRALVETIRIGWAQDTPAFRKLFASLFVPDASEEQAEWYGELMRRTTRPEVAARLVEAFGEIDVSHRLADVRSPTLVIHVRDDQRIPFEQGRILAAGIPGSRFVELEGRNHILVEHEPAWTRFKTAVSEFLGMPLVTATAAADRAAAARLRELTVREREILALLATGQNNQAIAASLGLSEKTIRNYLTRIFEKLAVSSRAQAIVLARDHAVVPGAH